MHFIRLSTALTAAFIWAQIPCVIATNQALMECEQKCSQKWSFPTPATSPPPKAEAKPTPVHSSITSEKSQGYYAAAPTTAPEPTTTPRVDHRPSTKEHVAAASPPPSSSSSSTTSTKPRATTQEPTPTPTPKPVSASGSKASSVDIGAYLAPHNAARAAHGASPLTWSDELADAAQRWANKCVFQHSGGSLGPFGENLAAGSGDYSPQSGVKAWVDEAGEYNSANPVPSHFTQVVWKATTQVGCAVASCNLANFDPQFWPVKYHVCEYSSPGNVIGQFATNVQA